MSGVSRRRRGSREKDKLELLLKIWRESRAESYNVGVLKTILSAEVKDDFLFVELTCLSVGTL